MNILYFDIFYFRGSPIKIFKHLYFYFLKDFICLSERESEREREHEQRQREKEKQTPLLSRETVVGLDSRTLGS